MDPRRQCRNLLYRPWTCGTHSRLLGAQGNQRVRFRSVLANSSFFTKAEKTTQLDVEHVAFWSSDDIGVPRSYGKVTDYIHAQMG